MTERSATHGSFTLERVFQVTPDRAFAAWADLDQKRRWFGCSPDLVVEDARLDFREGGQESWQVIHPTGNSSVNETVYNDVVANERIIYTCTMFLDDTKISVSLMTVEFKPHKSGTHLFFTEQATFLDGYDGLDDRIHGTNLILDSLDSYIAGL